MQNRWIVSIVLVFLFRDSDYGQQSTRVTSESHKYRTIFTLAGGGGGFTIGLLAGLAAFDDAMNSDRKVWTTAILAGIGGGVGGYFLGRALDKRRTTTTTTGVTGKSDSFKENLKRAQDPFSMAESKLVPPNRRRMALPSPATSSAASLDANDLYRASAVRKLQGVEYD